MLGLLTRPAETEYSKIDPETLKGVAVEIKDSVDHFHGHIRTQHGRKPQLTTNPH